MTAKTTTVKIPYIHLRDKLIQDKIYSHVDFDFSFEENYFDVSASLIENKTIVLSFSLYFKIDRFYKIYQMSKSPISWEFQVTNRIIYNQPWIKPERRS